MRLLRRSASRLGSVSRKYWASDAGHCYVPDHTAGPLQVPPPSCGGSCTRRSARGPSASTPPRTHPPQTQEHQHAESSRTAIGALVALTVAFSSAACGGSDSEDTATAGEQQQQQQRRRLQHGCGGGGAGVPEPAHRLPLTQPLSRKPDAGKRLIVTENPQAVTRKTNDGLEEGAKLLGWTVKREQVGAGPEDPAKAFDAALDQKPDAVLVSGNPASTFRAQLERATRENIPVILSDAGDPVGKQGSAYTIALDDFDQTGLWGKMTADYAASQGAKHVLVVDLSLYPILHAYSEGVVAELKKVGSGHEVHPHRRTDRRPRRRQDPGEHRQRDPAQPRHRLGRPGTRRHGHRAQGGAARRRPRRQGQDRRREREHCQRRRPSRARTRTCGPASPPRSTACTASTPWPASSTATRSTPASTTSCRRSCSPRTTSGRRRSTRRATTWGIPDYATKFSQLWKVTG